MSREFQKSAFHCRKCGQCCEGRGGIVVSPRDLACLSDFLGITPEAFTEQYTEWSGGKIKIRVGETGCCIFFSKGEGCAVHEVKPAVCRAWPFFRGNIIDSESFALAKEFCPGISPHIKHDDFARLGRQYLHEHNLLANDPACEAVTLILP